jgi:hypothetical protein
METSVGSSVGSRVDSGMVSFVAECSYDTTRLLYAVFNLAVDKYFSLFMADEPVVGLFYTSTSGSESSVIVIGITLSHTVKLNMI